MTAFELARQVGVPPASVRLYRRSGVLRAPHPLADGTRGYDEGDASLLRAIVGLRRLGVVPEDVVAPARSPVAPDEAIRRIRLSVERQRRSIARAKGRLDELDACLAGVASLLADGARSSGAQSGADAPGEA